MGREVAAAAGEVVAPAEDAEVVEELAAEMARRCTTAGRTVSASTSEPTATPSYQAT